MCSHSVPSRASSSVPVDHLPRRRKDRALGGAPPRPTRCRPAPRSRRSTAATCLRPLHLASVLPPFAHAPANLRPRHRRVRLHHDRSSARWRARCTRTGSSPPSRTAAGSSGPASSASGPNTCGTSSRLRSSSTSLSPSVRRICRRQDLDLVARHAARLGALRNLEQLVARRHARSARSPPSRSAASSRDQRQHASARRTSVPRLTVRSRILRSCTKSSAGVAVGHHARAIRRRDRSGRSTRNGRWCSCRPRRPVFVERDAVALLRRVDLARACRRRR